MASAGRFALVTGGRQGIGAAVVRRLAEKGYSVAVADLPNRDETEEKAGVVPAGGAFFGCNVGDAEDVARAMGEVHAWVAECDPERSVGALDVVVNSAGVTRDAMALKVESATWDAVMEINLRGSFLMVRLKEASEGEWAGEQAIVNMSSIVALHGNVGQTAYCASKAGVVGMTKALAKELAPSGIRVNAVAPGFIATPMTAAVPDKVMAMMRQQIPLGEVGEADDIAAVVEFLASRDARYVTGAVIEATGGLFM
ncbi:short-chain dehydrogenase/reductase SDR [Thecamonas trahens ATCC 50062]|uniref:Short-chain dehydrogenase/reductase SDR n=1 Tax=Thecamonas trahens ATCC 50062 TaxID=461836 RepID=A0A0L0DRX1_THETB|nr:short-chain dehydrogenase/reductase SDR [Thecamonas trahens ATCC 50062]KNC55045.1 short-chain dehydrogenase/reductase SDR [Thecamonas trahens ATCC 50062]|eukprot:XP_013753349.1 short-chain dehydrogenase/reductase SDR [Thecamonas trahens ATCC 50062]